MKSLPHSTNIFLSIFFMLVFIGCKKDKVLMATSSNIRFDNTFALEETIKFSSNDKIKSIMSITLDKNQNIVICDYVGEQVLKYNISDKRLTRLNDSLNGIKVLRSPIASTTDANGNIYISSNKNRRILIYDVFGRLKKSFLISGGNMTPVSLLAINDRLYMGGFNLQKGTLIHEYDLSGKYINDFIKEPKAVAKTKFGGTTNFPFFDICDGKIWVVQNMQYKIEQADLAGNLLNSFLFSPDYYVPISKKIEASADTLESIVDVQNLFSRQNALYSNDSNVFVQVEMPRKLVTANDFLKDAKFKLDIFNPDGSFKYCGIDCKNNRLLAIDKKKNNFYFLSKADYVNNEFIINKYKLINN